MKNRKLRNYLLSFIIALAVIGCVFIPIPYYIEQPGSTIDLKELITVNDKKDESSGSFSLTSVGIRQASVVTALKAKTSPFQELVSEKELFGGASGEEYDQIQKYYMASSQNAAIEQALKLANRPYTFAFKGVYVMSVLTNSSFSGKVAVGDTVTQVDGKKFESSQEFMDYVKGKNVGDEVTIDYLHQEESKKATGQLIELETDKKAGIGITLVDHTTIESEDEVEFHVDNIGGPSAGLMFTLEIYEQLTGNDLRKGKKIAGTGTMDNQGNVGRIGGIDKKVASASQEGMEIFFAPDDEITETEKAYDPNIQSNYQEAKKALKKLNSDMVIVPVKTLQDAIDYLEKME